MEWIDNCILGLFDMYETYDIYDLLDYLKIKVRFLDPDSALLNNNEAIYNRFSLDGEVIFMKSGLPINYERFILAHELGHAVLHTHILSAAYNYNFINTGKLERQANYFALKLNNFDIDEFIMEGMTLDQIASCLEVPSEHLKLISNI